jgi:hypothetical protein
VALSVAGFGNVEIYEPDPRLFWRLKPNQQCFTKVDHKPVHINSRGTRGPEFAVPKPAGTIRILSLGDSKTFGWGLTEAETYSSRVEALLGAQAGPGRRIEVVNAGVNAWSYPQIKVYLREHGLAMDPDFAVWRMRTCGRSFRRKAIRRSFSKCSRASVSRTSCVVRRFTTS